MCNYYQKLLTAALAYIPLVLNPGASLADQTESPASPVLGVLDLLTMRAPPSGLFVEVNADVRCDTMEFCRLIAPVQAYRIIILDFATVSQPMRLDLARRCSSESCKVHVSGTYAGDDITVRDIAIVGPVIPAGACGSPM